MNNTQKPAVKLADNYLLRLKTGEFSSFAAMRNAILTNVVNSEYARNSNIFVDYLWQRIHEKT
jgi:hypothetical protein